MSAGNGRVDIPTTLDTMGDKEQSIAPISSTLPSRYGDLQAAFS